MTVNIDNILKKQNKTRYWLSKTIGYSYPSLMQLCNNKSDSIQFEILEKICVALNCTPSDILIISRTILIGSAT